MKIQLDNFKKRTILFLLCFFTLQVHFAQVVINEVYIRPDGSASIPGSQLGGTNGLVYEGSKEYIELYNKGCSEADVTGYFITTKQFFNNNTSGITIRIPNVPAAKIPPGGHIVLASPKPGTGVLGNVDIPISSADRCGYNASMLIPNADGWIALHDPLGNPLECLYWSGAAGNIISKTDDFNPPGTICLPSGSPSGIVLQTAKQIYDNPNTKSLVTYIANSTPILIYRVKDGAVNLNGSPNWSIYGTPFNASTLPWTIDKTAPTGRCNGKDCVPQVASFKLNASTKAPSCGGSDGEISFSPDPAGQYSYTWPFPAMSDQSSSTGLKADSYKITISGNGCSKDTTIILSSPSGPNLTATKTDPTTCAGTGSIDITFTNTPDGSYNILYNNGTFPNVVVTGGKATIPNVLAGTYNDLQIEVNSCKSPLGKVVTLTGPLSPTLVATAKQPVTCTDQGSIDLTFTNTPDGSNNTITYNGNSSFSNVTITNSKASITNLAAGTYNDLQIEVNGCKSALGINVTLNAPPASPIATAIPKDAAKCLEKGSIELTLQNVPVASYDISYNNGQKFSSVAVSGNSAVILNVDLGTYNNLTFTANGCPVNVQPTTFNISGPTPISAIQEKMLSPFCGASDGKITVMSVTGGESSSIEYALNPGSFTTNPAFENLSSGNYTIYVRDSKDCKFEKPVVLTPGVGNPTVFIPNVFTPNDDENAVNEVWNVSVSCVKELNCQIFNRWGNLVHEITDPKGSWDGKDSAAGVYFYKLVISAEGDKKENYHGYITLIR